MGLHLDRSPRARRGLLLDRKRVNRDSLVTFVHSDSTPSGIMNRVQCPHQFQVSATRETGRVTHPLLPGKPGALHRLSARTLPTNKPRCA